LTIQLYLIEITNQLITLPPGTPLSSQKRETFSSLAIQLHLIEITNQLITLPPGTPPALCKKEKPFPHWPFSYIKLKLTNQLITLDATWHSIRLFAGNRELVFLFVS
jgi:hypothetical protein